MSIFQDPPQSYCSITEVLQEAQQTRPFVDHRPYLNRMMGFLHTEAVSVEILDSISSVKVEALLGNLHRLLNCEIVGRLHTESAIEHPAGTSGCSTKSSLSRWALKEQAHADL